MIVEIGTSEDLIQVLNWLKDEYQSNDGEGFWCNRNVIERAHGNGEFWVIRREGVPVAFQVGNYTDGITCVREDLQGRGLGSALFEATLDRAYQNNVNVLQGECSPRSSFPFWKKQGFERYGDFSKYGRIDVYRTIPRKFDLDDNLPKVEVHIDFYPEEVLRGEQLEPLVSFQGQGAMSGNGVLKLPERIICPRLLGHRDIVVKIVVDGAEICFCKAKHSESEASGVLQDTERSSFYLDEIILT